MQHVTCNVILSPLAVIHYCNCNVGTLVLIAHSWGASGTYAHDKYARVNNPIHTHTNTLIHKQRTNVNPEVVARMMYLTPRLLYYIVLVCSLRL